MSASADHCELCDLPMSQCVHGLPPPVTTPAPAPARPRRARPARGPAEASRPRARRWTPPEEFKPLILTVLERAGGELDAEEAFLRLEVLAAERLRPGDRETTPEGELRWRYAARRARVALIDEGLMAKSRPGVWVLTSRA